MLRQIALLVTVILAACGSLPERADPGSDAPEPHGPRLGAFPDAGSYRQALQVWKTPEDVNAWIGARFSYDTARAMALSETQRGRSTPLSIHPPQEFFVAPSGVCVDLSRFAVETLQRIDPRRTPKYLRIEFAPVTVAGNTLRVHWLASFKRDGHYYYFADSKRPGHIAGPYAAVEDFIHEYATYRGRQVVSFQERESYRRKERTPAATKADRDAGESERRRPGEVRGLQGWHPEAPFTSAAAHPMEDDHAQIRNRT
jgi:hypothetical protein